MSLLSTLIPGLMSGPYHPPAYKGRPAGGSSPIYGTCKATVINALDGLTEFTVPDIVEKTGLSRQRVNRVLFKLSAEGLVYSKVKGVNRYTQPTIWEVIR